MSRPNTSTPPEIKIQEGKDVFISYSRKDQEFVRWLNVQFQESGREPWIDWSGIQPGEEWWKSILKGIDSANTFVFVISPDSLQSGICPKEIERAVGSGKRMVPVVCREMNGLAVYPELAKLNYIFLRTEEEKRENLSKLFQALDTDLNHVQAHTKFLIRAREWEARGQSSPYLLRGGLLREADEWLSQVGTKLPSPTELHSRYILASRAADRNRQRVTLTAITGGLVLALGLAALAIWQYQQAETRRVEAETQKELAEEQRQEAQTQRGKAELARGEAETARDEAKRHLATSDYIHGDAEFKGDNPVEAIAYLAASLRSDPSARAAYKRLYTELSGQWFALESGEPIPLGVTPWSIKFRQDDQLLLVQTSNDQIRILDVASRRERLPPVSFPEGTLSNAGFDSTGAWYGGVTTEDQIAIWSSESGEKLPPSDPRHNGIMKDILATMRKGPQKYYGGPVWDYLQRYQAGGDSPVGIRSAKGEPISEFEPEDAVTMKLEFSADGRYVATTARFEDSEVHRIDTGEVVTIRGRGTLQSSPGLNLGRRLTNGLFNSGGSLFGACVDNRSLAVWELPEEEGEQARPMFRVRARDSIRRLAFSHDGEFVAGGDTQIFIWKLRKLEPPVGYGELPDAMDAAFSPDGAWLAVVTNSHLDLYSTQTSKLVRQYQIESGQAVAWFPQSTMVAVANAERVEILSPASGEVVARVEEAIGTVEGMRVFPGPLLAVASPSGSESVGEVTSSSLIRAWEWQSGRLVKQDVHGVTSQMFADASVSKPSPQTVMVLGNPGKESDRPFEHDRPVNSAHLNPSRDLLLTATGDLADRRSSFYDGVVQLWDVKTGAEGARERHFERAVRFAHFDPAGRWLVASDEIRCEVWDTGDPAEMPALELAETAEAICGWRVDPDSGTLIPVNQQAALGLLAQKNPRNWMVQAMAHVPAPAPTRQSADVPVASDSQVAPAESQPMTATAMPAPVQSVPPRPSITYQELATRPFDAEDFSMIPAATLRLLRNEILARHGLIFSPPEWADYFRAQPWYRPLVTDLNDEDLPAVELHNLNLIKAEEKRRES
jgi:WD40 repeat protein